MKKGFTLVELAIVLIIIGVIFGSIMKSTELIKSAKAKKNISDITVLADAQHRFYERNQRFAGDADNNGLIDYGTINTDTYPDETNVTTADDMDFPFAELENMEILGVKDNSEHASLTEGGPAYFAGITVTDSSGNTLILNMVTVRQVPCLTAFLMEQSIDKNQADSADSASTGRVRAILNNTLAANGAWTATNICGNNPDSLTNLAYLFDRF